MTPSNQYLYRIQPTRPAMLGADPTEVKTRAAGEEKARAIMEGDPAVRAGVMRARLFPYRIALAGPIPPLDVDPRNASGR